MTQPMVVVKKPDGSFEHITLEELKKRRSAAKKAVVDFVVPPAQVVAPVTPAKPVTVVPQIPIPVPTPVQENKTIVAQRSLTPTPSHIPTPAPAKAVAMPDPKIAARVAEIRERARQKTEVKITPHSDDFMMSDMLPQKFVKPPVPATTTPHNDFVHSNKVITAPDPVPLAKSTPVPTVSNVAAAKPTVNVTAPPSHRPVVNDIITRPQSMSPMDEIKYFSLVDFRRLSNDPIEAAARLKQKFINLKDESIVLYFEALEVWHSSPLYLDHMNAVSSALSAKTSLANATNNPGSIQPKEIAAIVLMEKELL